MVNDQNQDTLREPVKQGVRDVPPEPNKIGACTPYDFGARNLTAYGGLLPVATLLEKLGFQQLVEESLSVKRKTRAMPMYRFVLAMVLACYCYWPGASVAWRGELDWAPEQRRQATESFSEGRPERQESRWRRGKTWRG
jgi:hypothetical protein